MSLETVLREFRRPMALVRVLGIIRAIHFTGSVTIHFRGGTEQRIEVGRPTMIDLVASPPSGSLDTDRAPMLDSAACSAETNPTTRA